MPTKRRPTTGIRERHSRNCPMHAGGPCRCNPGYEASVYSAREKTRKQRTFPTIAAAKMWRADAMVALRKGTMRIQRSETVAEAAEAWMTGVESGAIRNRSGQRFKPSAVRGYEAALRLRILPAFGPHRLTEIRRADVQDYVDALLAEHMNPSTIANTLMPLRSIYRRALARGVVDINPTANIELPAVTGRRDRALSTAEIAALLRALPEADKALWCTAAYAGLRMGELQALGWDSLDIDAGLIHVERSWDRSAGFIPPKSRAGRRRVPIPRPLEDVLRRHQASTGGNGLVFGRTPDAPFDPSTVIARARKVWRAAGLEPVTPHELRHAYVTLMAAAGLNLKALSAYAGHASISITMDRYAKLMPGYESEAVELLDALLAGAKPNEPSEALAR